VVNSVIFCAALLKERIVRRDCQVKQTVKYNQLQWLGPEHRAELLADIRQRTGLDVVRVRIRTIDLCSSTATLTIWYYDLHANGNGNGL
jgi:hypothetical protein